MQKKKNNESTRFYSDSQEKKVAELLNGKQTSNSGAGRFEKGDIIIQDASLLIECKTCIKNKDSISVKEVWITKNKEEAFSNRLLNNAVCFNFGPNKENYFIINEKLMKFLVDKLVEDNQ